MKDNQKKEKKTCELCGLECEPTKHHLVPKLKSKRGKYRELKEDSSNLLWICRSCHDQIHSLWNETTLRDLYSTREKLLAAPEMQKFIAWKRKHPDFIGHSKMSNARRQ